MLACSHRSARIPARPLVKARSHVALQPGAAADDMSELFSGSFPVPPFVSALLRGLLRRPAPAKPLLCLRPRSGSGSPVPVPPEKPLLVLGAAPTRFRVPETDGQNRRNECTSTELLSSVSSAAMPKRRSATRRTSQCFRSQPKRRGGTTLGRGNPGPNGIDASLSADWLNSPAASLKVLTSPSRASCAATNTSGRSLLAIRGRLSRSESGKSASTPSSNSTAPPSGNQPATATRRCPAKGHFLTRYRKVYPQVRICVAGKRGAEVWRSTASRAPRWSRRLMGGMKPVITNARSAPVHVALNNRAVSAQLMALRNYGVGQNCVAACDSSLHDNGTHALSRDTPVR